MASNNIKGLTVEIGGDTTKLGKALESVNKKSRDLSSELGQINKLLKMDPGNTELLAQKQKVLADAVSTTKEKLDTLKEAERQVQKQFEKGEVSEAQVRELQREIIATTKKLEGYENAARETADAVEELGKSSAEVEDGTKKAKKGADKAADSLDDMSDSAKKAEKSGGSLGSTLASVAKGGLAAIAAGVTALVGGLAASAEATREYRTEMGKLEAAFTTNGHSSEAATKTYQTLQGVLGETEQAVEAANHLAKLTDNEKDLATWTNIATGVYATFGASLPIEGLTEAANETAKVGQVTGPLADALNWAGVSEDAFNESLAACTSEQERQTLIMETLNGLYDEAAEKYRETNAEVIRANEANEAWTASMAEVGGAVEPILTDIKLLAAGLLSDLVPGVKEAAEAFRGLLNGEEGAAEALGASISGIFDQLLSMITEILPAIAQTAVSLITTLTNSLLGQLPALTETLMLILTQAINSLAIALPSILVSLVQAFYGIIDQLLEGAPQLLAALTEVVFLVLEALPDILEIAAAGLQEALLELLHSVLPAIIEAIPALVEAVVTAITQLIPIVLEAALALFTALVEAIPLIIPPLVEAIPQIITTLVTGLTTAIPLLLQGAIQLLNAIIQAIPIIIQALMPQLPTIISAIIDGLLSMLPVLLEGCITLLMALIDAIPTIVIMLQDQLPTIIGAISSTLFNNLPKIQNAAIKLFWGIIAAIPKIVVQLVKQVPTMITAIVKGLSAGVSSVATVGMDLIRGLWNGISDMVGWITGKIEGFGESVLGGIKNFFGIKSPSRVFKNEVGKMLAVGLADGIEDNADKPLDAMADLSGGLMDEAASLNGLTLERQLNHTFTTPTTVSPTESGMLARLDSILAAIEKGQILTIDGRALVGATAGMTDNALGQRRALAARGAV